MTTALKPAFVFDVNRCVGCRACEMACVHVNQLNIGDLPASGSWREVRTFNELLVPGVEKLHLSMACNHCEDAPCMAQCPARAYSRDEATGAVLIDPDRCLGCRYCAWVCPYDAPRFNEALGVMTKCTFCVDRQHEGLEPSCTLSCPTGALKFERRDIGTLSQEVAGFAQASTRPAVAIMGLEPARRLPRTHVPGVTPPWQVLWQRIIPRVTFRHEWPLALFTWLLAVMTGLLAGAISGRVTLDWRLFLAAGVLGMGLSASHLGRKSQAWRAPLHGNRSWLSREILLATAFLATATLGLTPISGADGWLRAGLYSGLVCLLAVDMVYRVGVIRGSGPLHSAHTLMTGLMLMGAAAGDLWILVPLALLKLVLFWTRQWNRRRLGLTAPRPLGVARTVATLAGTALLGGIIGPIWLGFSLLALGEFLDRARFYDELEIPTPSSLMLDGMPRT
nr:4Fe-4S dicluster domain-containing protein [Candidatus Krumholzibacteria bacterium]